MQTHMERISTSTTITGLAPNSTHTYMVSALDSAAVESAQSASAAGTGSVVTGWNVQFDLDPSENVESSADFTYTNGGNHYTLTSTSSDATIAAGSTLTFQFSGDYRSA